MANKLQTIIYNASVAAPLLLVFAAVWFMQEKTLGVTLACVVIAVLLIVLLGISFSYGKKHLAPIRIRTGTASPRDSQVMVYIISYLLPLLKIVVSDINLAAFSLIAVAIILFMPFLNMAVPNFLLMLKGYHFYEVSSEAGITGYLLLTKRTLDNKQDLKTVYRMFGLLLLDAEE